MIRQFWLTNESGEEWDLRPNSESMFANPKGMAEGLGSRSYWQGTRAFAQTNYKDAQSNITGMICFTSGAILTSFEEYVAKSGTLYLHVMRNGVPERYCEVECAVTERPEDFAGWVMASATFRRMSPWKSPERSVTKTVSSVASVAFPVACGGALPCAFTLEVIPSGADYYGTVSVTDGDSTLSMLADTVEEDASLIIVSEEGIQSITNQGGDVYQKIDFASSGFFEAKPGSTITVSFGASFTGTVKLTTKDQWNEA